MALPHLLEIQTGRHKGRKIRLTDEETIIGRAQDAKIRISSDDVSRHHCLLMVRGDDLVVRDLGSRNGTFVNGRPIDGDVILKPGGLITIGPLALRLVGEQAEEPDRDEVKITVKSASQIAEPLSDDEIASWLSDAEQPAKIESDTATFDVPAVPSKTSQRETDLVAKPRRKQFASVAEEARDIIRRHLESLEENS